jgi:hypothetical protein
MARPDASEHAPYFSTYIDLVEGDRALTTLQSQLESVPPFLRGIADPKSLHRYAPGKWSLREVLGHLNDTERIFAYRALRIARADKTPLPPFDENHFVAHANFDAQGWPALIAEFEMIRRSTLALVRPWTEEVLERSTVVSGHRMTARALTFMMAGHVEHHLRIIQERYL